MAGWKMVCNERVEFWGSLIELVKYRVRGDLSDDVPGRSGLAGRLKPFLLFEIDNKSLHGGIFFKLHFLLLVVQ